MELTRRDVVAALAAVGAGSLAGCAAPRAGDALDGGDRETLVAVAEAVYPSAVENVPAFVRGFADGRYRGGEHTAGVAAAIADLDEYAVEWEGAPFADLPVDARATLLDEMGVDAVDPAPEGLTDARVRYYLVNDLLYALYTTPTGASLAGLENPPGYPGGTASYQRGPE